MKSGITQDSSDAATINTNGFIPSGSISCPQSNESDTPKWPHPAERNAASPVSASKQLPKSLLKSIESTHVEYRQVGSSGLRVSNPILGTLGIGDKKWMDWVITENDVSY